MNMISWFLLLLLLLLLLFLFVYLLLNLLLHLLHLLLLLLFAVKCCKFNYCYISLTSTQLFVYFAPVCYILYDYIGVHIDVCVSWLGAAKCNHMQGTICSHRIVGT